jgi:hypothetical protein
MAAAAAALAVTDELVLPLRAVGDLAAAAGVSREEVVVITQCAALGELLNPVPPFSNVLGLARAGVSKYEGMINISLGLGQNHGLGLPVRCSSAKVIAPLL